MNICVIKGRLVRDPEIRSVSTKNGEKTVVDFSVAVDRSYGEGADFFTCQAWAKTAEAIDKFFVKGQEILLSGSMECDPYETKDGTKRYPWRLKVTRFEFCGSKKDNPSRSDSARVDGYEPIEDDDVPF